MISASRFAREHKRAVYHIYTSSHRLELEKHVDRISGEMMRSYVEAQGPRLARERGGTKSSCATSTASASRTIFYEWLENGMKEDLEAQIRRLSLLFTGNIRASLSRVADPGRIVTIPGGHSSVSAGSISPAKEICHAILDHLEPRAVFSCFEQLCAIPHGSGNTKAISDYLVRFAAEHQLRCIQDAHNNIIIFAPGTPGYESAAPVILQGHMDMVCETAPDCTKDMAREGLDLFVDGDTIGARGTTLGGDDAIAVAMALAILAADDIPHPPLEVVITVDEETGMLGAAALDASVLKGRTMLNLDSEDEGRAHRQLRRRQRVRVHAAVTRAPFSGTALTVTVGGLLGGHSGAEIDKGRGNAKPPHGPRAVRRRRAHAAAARLRRRRPEG